MYKVCIARLNVWKYMMKCSFLPFFL